jgi:hypothetical protein
MCVQLILLATSTVCLVLSILILVKLNKNSESYTTGVNSIDCSYGLGGGNTAYCNDWLDSYRKGKPCKSDDNCHPNIMGKIDCKKALKCCNQLTTCNGGKECKGNNLPSLNNNIKYDRNIVIDA